ncbi:MAG: cadherin-like beta sandwich domain-containing protein [Clostridia bacterium]|nr:cadherin-like beta sandwich domain-containing protein [Clostridia bacterium]
MKNKIFRILKGRALAWLLALVLLVPIAGVTGLVGVCYTAKLSGETEVRPGHSFTLRLSMDSGAFGCQGILSYDSSVLKLTGVEPVNGKFQEEFHFYSENGLVIVTHDTPVTKMLKITFTVLDTAEIGSTTTVSFTSGEILNGSRKEAVNDVFYTLKMVDAKSDDATLKTLGVKVFAGDSDETGFMPTLNPSFSASTALYSATVPNEYSSYEINGVCNDSAAEILSSTEGELEEGMNTLVITVRAENGSEKEYTLMLFRERPPEISQVVSYESTPEPDVSIEEPDESSEEESEADSSLVSEEESELSEDTSSEESIFEESTESIESFAESSVSSPELVITTPYQSDSGNWTGIILCIAVVGGVCIVALVIRIFVLFRKKQNV